MDVFLEACCLPAEDLVCLTYQEAEKLLVQFPCWHIVQEGRAIARKFVFPSFQAMVTFVNGVFWIANDQKHYPRLEVGYDHCTVFWTTYAVSGLSRNDFTGAAKVDQLFGIDSVD